MVPQRQPRRAFEVVGLEIERTNPAVENFPCLVDRQDLRLVQFLENIAHAQHHHLVANDQHPPVGIMKVYRIERRAEAQNDIRPALAARRPVVKFPEPGAMPRFFGIALANPQSGETVEHAEFSLAKALVDHRSRPPARKPAGFADGPSGLPRAQIG